MGSARNALGGIAFAGWAMIVVQFEQSWLLGARLGLRLAQRHQIAPEIAAAVDRFALLAWLQPMQIIHGALRMRGGAENQPLVVLQRRLKPVADILFCLYVIFSS